MQKGWAASTYTTTALEIPGYVLVEPENSSAVLDPTAVNNEVYYVYKKDNSSESLSMSESESVAISESESVSDSLVASLSASQSSSQSLSESLSTSQSNFLSEST
ncbi:MucBP domain-containing protein, partial [Streptococcus danieliae]|nr:MucBP domain-containing protein [Streptococcus danieliae]